MSGKKRASTRNRVVSSSPERMSCGRIHSPDVVIEDHECYPQDDPRALASQASPTLKKKPRKKSADSEVANNRSKQSSSSPKPSTRGSKSAVSKKKPADSQVTNNRSKPSSPSPKPSTKGSKCPAAKKKQQPKKKPEPEIDVEAGASTSSTFSCSRQLKLRKGTTVTSEKTINELVVLPNYEIPRLIMPRYPSQVDLTDSDSDDNFDSDLEIHVQNFAPNYNLLSKKDKKYVISTVKYMITQVRSYSNITNLSEL